MKRSLRKLIGYTLETNDGARGKVKDFLFDEKNWIIRYLSANFKKLIEDQRVLIPHTFLKKPLWTDEYFPIDLFGKDIENCPKPEENLPVSRKYEEELNKFYEIDDYWSWAFFPPVRERISPGMPTVPESGGVVPQVDPLPPKPSKIPSKVITEEDMDTNLRSFKEVRGYQIHAIDGLIGHLDDLIIDDSNWQIVYAVVDTSSKLSLIRKTKVLISTEWMKSISYVHRELIVNLHINTIKAAPEFKFDKPLNEEYEKELFEFMEGKPENIESEE